MDGPSQLATRILDNLLDTVIPRLVRGMTRLNLETAVVIVARTLKALASVD